ncbi:hypothetical protein [Mumia sp. DW29H23]|uniref:hypothetical protein n=1 Tax=Mumia sp. DW29H23 TaxID=3421241 RepID=UPI003D6948FB
MGPSRLSVRSRRLGLRTAAVASVALTAALLAGCEDDPEADGTTSRLCGILDESAAAEVTGDAEVSGFGGGDLDATRRQGNAITCTVSTSGGEDRIQITTMDLADQAERDEMQAQLADEIEGSTDCAPRTDDPPGYVCERADETTIAVVFPDRWVRVTANARVGGTPPAPDAAIAVAENVDKNLTAHDEDQ